MKKIVEVVNYRSGRRSETICILRALADFVRYPSGQAQYLTDVVRYS